MASKRGILKILGIFALGFLVGGIVLGGLIVWFYVVMFQNMEYAQLAEITNTAFMIRAGHEEELVKNIEENLRQTVPFIASMQSNDKVRLNSLWYVQRYYERFDVNVPAEIKPIFDSLPPRSLASCEIRKLQKAEPNKMEPNNPPETEKSGQKR